MKCTTLTPDGLGAAHVRGSSDKGVASRGVLFSQLPIKPDSHGNLYYEVVVAAVEPGTPYSDGLTMGFTLTDPATIQTESLYKIEDVPGLIAVGFSGYQWDYRRWPQPCQRLDEGWSPARLAKGQHIGCVLVQGTGDFVLVVGGQVECTGPEKVDLTKRMWAVVELRGNCHGLTWVSGAKAPNLVPA
jgi:hypothetical protein